MPDGELELTTSPSISNKSSDRKHKESSTLYLNILYSTMYIGEILVVILLAISSYASLQKGYTDPPLSFALIGYPKMLQLQGPEDSAPAASSASLQQKFISERFLQR